MNENPLKRLLRNNTEWAARIKRDDPDFFEKLSRQQAPQYLWIGCSDSRVPANQIVGLVPGEVFVHRNVANLVVPGDLNCLSVLQFAVDVLGVRHIIICGHYGCSGIHAAIHDRKIGLADAWLRHAREEFGRHGHLFRTFGEKGLWDAACETNVIDQVRSVVATSVVQEAWARGQPLDVHGWVYGVHDGLLRELITDIRSNKDIEEKYEQAIATVARK